MTSLISAPFVQLPIVVNPEILLREIQALDKSHWRAHHFNTLQSIPLVDMDPFEPFWYDAASHLPYLMSILHSWKAPIGKSRISILKPNATVEEHVDVDHYWKYRLRVHIVVKSNPKAIFGCDDQILHLPEGQLWVSNNWAPHWIANNGDSDRIHIVIDTVGSPKLWELISKGWHSNSSRPLPTVDQLDGAATPQDIPDLPCLEHYSTLNVRHPSEVEGILKDTLEELVSTNDDVHRAAFQQLIQEWRSLFFSHQHSQRRAYNTVLQHTLSTLPHDHLNNGLALHTVLQTQIGDSLRPAPDIAPILLVCPSFLETEGRRVLNICLDNMDTEKHLTTDSTSFQSAWNSTLKPHPIITQHIREQWFKKLSVCLQHPKTKLFWVDEKPNHMKSKRLWLHNMVVPLEDINTWRTLFPTAKIIFLLPPGGSSNQINVLSDESQQKQVRYHQQVLDILKAQPHASNIVVAVNNSSSFQKHTVFAIEKLNLWLNTTLSFETLFSSLNISLNTSLNTHPTHANDLDETQLQILKIAHPISEDALG